ncbi:MAG: DUF4384 domain-containing protein [Acidobacteriota bacterium]
MKKKAQIYLSVLSAIILAAIQVPVAGAQGKGSANVWSDPVVKVKPKATPKPTPKPGKPKPRPPRPKVQLKPLLTLEFKIVKRGEDGTPLEVNPYSTFYTGDWIQIKVKPNQEGYLYILSNNEGLDQEMIFPDSRINNGQNFVKKNQEYTIPLYCDSRFKFDDGTCWLKVQAPAGKETFFLVFSRDAVSEIPKIASENRGLISQAVIQRMVMESKQNLGETSRPGISRQQGGGAGGYAIWVTNYNKVDNDQMIAKISINHEDK